MPDEKGKVWVVTDGEYSDYRIVAVFEEETTAREFSGAGAYTVEEWEFAQWKPGEGTYNLEFDEAGRAHLIAHHFKPLIAEEFSPGTPGGLWWSDTAPWSIFVRANSPEMAIKTAGEAYIRFRAEFERLLPLRSRLTPSETTWCSADKWIADAANVAAGLVAPPCETSISGKIIRRLLDPPPVGWSK